MSYSTKVISTLSSRDFLKMSTLSYIMDRKGSAYGREIITHIKSKDNVWTPSHSSLYPLLSQMVNDNLLYIDDEIGKKKFYKLTAKGREYYQEASKDFIDMLKTTSEFYSDFAKNLHVEEENETNSKGA